LINDDWKLIVVVKMYH